jgi:hypothetical protein
MFRAWNFLSPSCLPFHSPLNTDKPATCSAYRLPNTALSPTDHQQTCYVYVKRIDTDIDGRAVYGLGLKLVYSLDRGFEF